ncbi:MAG: electron transfer flavoprotein subunit alpha/FixB family protein [Anaerolineae bacterium]|nr:electron transfer flavoprotein subunit alpha/FixB family protein [Anaerolineae bacterium]MCB9132858.1 electron transfer flavoprotein subunit alpha/FixB family protein [Anaerolineales bacterium]MCB0246371.1 electron transfer flavoprotein subunit alpha/FixB family protein [Anaerolineae bacterium]MCB0250418.1 electron transfer flavoprotein subunit alpha/FixB family protein [Anaerolineae bacterium]MCB9143573.1 electron transfer flavoprotein subunit alpha/FixB family protein [Anaerolineales bacte
MSILVYIEQFNGQASPVSWEVLGKAKSLAGQMGGKLAAVVIGNGVEAVANEALTYGADVVHLVEDASLAAFRIEPYAAVVEDLVKAHSPKAVLFPATTRGRDLSAVVACDLGAGLAADCSDLAVDGGELTAVRPVFSGNMLTTVRFVGPLAVASIRPRSFPTPEADGAAGEIVRSGAVMAAGDIREQIDSFEATAGGEVSLTDAKIIVSGGRGVAKDPELGFKLVKDLADSLGGAMGASRAAVDAGYIPYKHQVGQTGKTVRPDLYIACGISGAIQHLAGMGNSKIIVAINKDPEAPIFQVANYGVVGDLFEVVPALTAEFKKRL